MEGTETWNKLTLSGPGSKYTFFAPHNRAFLNVTAQERATFNNPHLSTDYANTVFSYHIGQYGNHFLDQELITYRYSSRCCWGDALKMPKVRRLKSGPDES